MFESLTEKLKKMRNANTEDADVTFKPFAEPEATPITEERYEEVKKPSSPMIAGTDDADSNIELKVVRPATFDEVSTIADYLLEGCTVVLNMELLDRAATIRMLDFLNGVTYSTDGEIKNVSRSTYIITPHNVDVSDDT